MSTGLQCIYAAGSGTGPEHHPASAGQYLHLKTGFRDNNCATDLVSKAAHHLDFQFKMGIMVIALTKTQKASLRDLKALDAH